MVLRAMNLCVRVQQASFLHYKEMLMTPHTPQEYKQEAENIDRIIRSLDCSAISKNSAKIAKCEQGTGLPRRRLKNVEHQDKNKIWEWINSIGFSTNKSYF